MRMGYLLSGLLASGTAWLTIVATQAMTGHERGALLLLGYVASWFLLFGVAAGLPLLFSEARRRLFAHAFVVFGAGGGIAGALIAVLLITNRLGGSPTAVLVDFAIPLVLPWMLGAVIIYWLPSASGK